MDQKKMPNFAGQKSLGQGNIKRLPRQSQPNYAIESILSSVAKIKQQHEVRRGKRKRQARLSEIDVGSGTGIGFSPSRFDDIKVQGQTHFLSPTAGHQQRFLKKCTSSSNICNEIISPRGVHKGQKYLSDLKQRKLIGKQKKDSLNMIEQMLSNHIQVNSATIKPKTLKSPRYSQPLMMQNQFQFLQKKKQNQSLGRRKNQNDEAMQKITEETMNSCPNIGEHRQKELKETVSTLASVNAQKFGSPSIKITDFEFIKDVGKGKFGSVKLALHKKTGFIFSIKMIKKSVIKEENISDQILNQIKIQAFLNHSNIVKLYTVFHDRLYVYLVLQACTEGNLYQFMQSKGKVSEDDTSIILKSICQAVAQLHQHQIIHRDLKPENIVLCYGMPKICDFGWSTCLRDSMRQTFCGTPLYVSPQLLSGKLYDQKVDLWALGILGYEMITGTIPFNIKSQRDLSKIIDSQIRYPASMKKSTVECLKSMLQKNPKKRKSVQEILQHKFFSLSLGQPRKKQ